jgi:dihydroneopterin aldolase/2-amino-4-hydroxy-6-hydroxymethyldihydropteridine diphosphokinase
MSPVHPVPPVLDGHGRPLDQIQLVGLTVFGYHGVFESERRAGQDFSVDLVLHLNTRPAAANDDLTRTVHYGELATAVAEVVRGPAVDLIETLAERIAVEALSDLRVAAVDVAVHKPSAPITERFADVIVRIRRHRAEFAALAAARREAAAQALSERAGPPDVLDAAPGSPARAVLALGTNLGDRMAILVAAIADLEATEGLRVVAVSPVVETAPVGGPKQADYLNAVVVVETTLSPNALLAACQAVESGHGRERTVRWGPRTLDVDVITYADLVARSDTLELPHPRAHERGFVLVPWAAVDPTGELPGGAGARAVLDLLEDVGTAGVTTREDLILDGAS